MASVLSLLLILGTSLIVTRVASVALEHTGLSRDSARFQARSAFTGVGFTTTEAESMVTNPVRRKIVMALMLFGNVGIVSAVAAVLLSAIDLRTQTGVAILAGVLLLGIAMIIAIGTNAWIDRYMCRAIAWALRRWTSLDTQDYARLLHLNRDYSVSRFRVGEGDWIDGHALSELRLPDEGVLVLGIECPGGHFIGSPPIDLAIRHGDELVIYGPTGAIDGLLDRDSGALGEAARRASADHFAARLSGEREEAGR